MGYIRVPRTIVKAPDIRVEEIALEANIHSEGRVIEARPAPTMKEKHIRLAFFGLRRQAETYSPTSSVALMDVVAAVTRYEICNILVVPPGLVLNTHVQNSGWALEHQALRKTQG